MRPVPRTDGAADVTIGLLLAVGAACWTGLVAAQLGRFHLAPVTLAGVAAGAIGWRGLRRPAVADDPGARWRRLDGPLVFLLAALLYLPGYDTTLYGSDATVYLGSGGYIARTGSLAVDEPLLQRLPRALEEYAFPPMSRGTRGTAKGPAARSPAGLVYEGHPGPIYSTFSQLPSVWVAIGMAAGGLAGGLAVVPLLAAGALMAFYVFVRRTSGVVVAAVAAALLGAAVPQVVFARVTMGECGAQWFLWSGLLAYARFHETGAKLAALAAGMGFGLAGLARPEYIAFLPVSLLVLWFVRGEPERLPRLVTAATTLLFVHALVLVTFVVPTHYRHIFQATMLASGLAGDAAARVVPVAVLAAFAAAAAVAMTLVENRRRLHASRAMLAAFLALWAIAYAMMEPSPSFGKGLPWLRYDTSWVVLVLAVAGLPWLVRRWGASPAGRLACAVAAVAAVHLFYDIHASPFPVWASRRLVPMILPVLFAAAATAIGALAARRVLASAVAALAVALNVWNSRDVFGAPFFAGTSQTVAQIAEMLPRDALVFVDSALMPAELDAPLLLLHDRHAVQARGITAGVEDYMLLFTVALPDVPIYLVRPGTYLPPAPRPAHRVRFDPAGEVRALFRVPGYDPAGMPFHVKLFRVVYTPP